MDSFSQAVSDGPEATGPLLCRQVETGLEALRVDLTHKVAHQELVPGSYSARLCVTTRPRSHSKRARAQLAREQRERIGELDPARMGGCGPGTPG